MDELSDDDIAYPRDLFADLIARNSPYAFYLFQWVPYQTDAQRWRLKMLHDVRTFDGREALGIWPNGSSCGPFRDDEVEFIRISRKQWGEEWKDPRPARAAIAADRAANGAGADERAAFEGWAASEMMSLALHRQIYVSTSTSLAWLAWQARAALAPPPLAAAAERDGLERAALAFAIVCGELSKGLPADDPLWRDLREAGEMYDEAIRAIDAAAQPAVPTPAPAEQPEGPGC